MKDYMYKAELSKVIGDIYTELTRDSDTKDLDPYEAVEVIHLIISSIRDLQNEVNVWKESNRAKGRIIKEIRDWLDNNLYIDREHERALRAIIGEE